MWNFLHFCKNTLFENNSIKWSAPIGLASSFSYLRLAAAAHFADRTTTGEFFILYSLCSLWVCAAPSSFRRPLRRAYIFCSSRRFERLQRSMTFTFARLHSGWTRKTQNNASKHPRIACKPASFECNSRCENSAFERAKSYLYIWTFIITASEMRRGEKVQNYIQIALSSKKRGGLAGP